MTPRERTVNRLAAELAAKMRNPNVVMCDHGTAKVPVCSCCFHQRIYDVSRNAGLDEKLSDYVADVALEATVNDGAFEDNE